MEFLKLKLKIGALKIKFKNWSLKIKFERNWNFENYLRIGVLKIKFKRNWNLKNYFGKLEF